MKKVEQIIFRQPIKLIVDTYGGIVYDGLALVSTIDTSKTPVYTYCYGKAMSMGFIIFASGHKRFVHHLATLMYHQISQTTRGKTEEIKESVAQSDKLMEVYDRYILNVTKLPKSKLDEIKKLKTEWYMFGEEALSYNLADELLESTRQK